MTDEYFSLSQLVQYSKISRRQLERYLRQAERPLPHVRYGRRYLVLRSKFDAWIVLQSQPRLERKHLAKARSLREIAAEVKAGVSGVR
jgi:hypothetical protein